MGLPPTTRKKKDTLSVTELKEAKLAAHQDQLANLQNEVAALRNQLRQAQRLAAASSLEALRNEITARTDEVLVEIARDDEQLSLLETGLLPQAEGALASSLAAYATGQVSFLTLIDNQMNLYQLQLQWLDLIADHERNLADLEYLVGEPLAAESPTMEVSGNAH